MPVNELRIFIEALAEHGQLSAFFQRQFRAMRIDIRDTYLCPFHILYDVCW